MTDNARVFGGRCWMPPEWRQAFPGLLSPRWPGGRIAVTGAASRQHAADILLRTLPALIPDQAVLTEHPELVKGDGQMDVVSARRMLRRVHGRPAASGIKALVSGGVIHPDNERVYVWSRTRSRQKVYAVSADGHELTLIGEFKLIKHGPRGDLKRLVAVHAFSGSRPSVGGVAFQQSRPTALC